MTDDTTDSATTPDSATTTTDTADQIDDVTDATTGQTDDAADTTGDTLAGASDRLPEGVRRRSFGGEELLATRGPPVGDEPTDGEWRAWEPSRSKLAATYAVGLDPGLSGGDTVLYLGAANGTTVSHVADFAGRTYAVEFAARPVRDLLAAAADRDRLFPLVKDARRPETYAHVVERGVDAVVQDVATRGQADVACANRRFLAPDGRLVLAVKARSEDVAADPERVFEAARERLRDDYEIRETARLDRFHDDHLAVVARPR